MDALNFLESERHLEFDVGGRIGVVGEFLMVVIAVFLVAEAEGLVPAETEFLPFLEPLHLGTGANEELHLHLLELSHAEDELTGNYFVTESLAYLGDAEGDAHTACLLHVEVVDKDALGGLGTEIDCHRAVGCGAHLGFEHEVELAYFCPVLGAGNGAYDLFVDNYLAEAVEVAVIHCLCKTLVEGVASGNDVEHAGICLTEHGFVEVLAEAFGCFCHFLVDLLVHLGDVILDEHIGTIAFLGVFVVNERIVESVDVA